jgi:hypothetical protein
MSSILFDNVYFFNYYGAGDVFVAKEFIKAMMAIIPTKKFWYAHAKTPRLLEDIDNLYHTNIVPERMENTWRCQAQDNSLYINTWIGLESSDVLPGIGVTVENYYRMFNRMLMKLNMKLGTKWFLPGPPTNYIPTTDFSKIAKEGIQCVNQFIMEHPGDTVLISNGEVQSAQAENFDFTPLVEQVSKDYPDKVFILTSPSPLRAPNVFYTSEFIKTVDGVDLNEIGYLSTFCRVIVGRNSSPYVFCLLKENITNTATAFVAFNYSFPGAIFVQTPMPCGRLWTNSPDPNKRLAILKEILDAG